MYKTRYTDASLGWADSRRDVSSTLSYTIPSSGYLYVSCTNEGWEFKDIMSNLGPHNDYSLSVQIYRDGNFVDALTFSDSDLSVHIWRLKICNQARRASQ